LPGGHPPIATEAHDRRNSPENERRALGIRDDVTRLRTVEKGSEPHDGIAENATRPYDACFNDIGVNESRRAGIGRRVLECRSAIDDQRAFGKHGAKLPLEPDEPLIQRGSEDDGHRVHTKGAHDETEDRAGRPRASAANDADRYPVVRRNEYREHSRVARHAAIELTHGHGLLIALGFVVNLSAP